MTILGNITRANAEAVTWLRDHPDYPLSHVTDEDGAVSQALREAFIDGFRAALLATPKAAR
jgi:hypothetical protein